MNAFLFDASALAKRYVPEAGTSLVNHLFAHVGRDRLLCSMLGAAEVAAAIVRQRNRGQIDLALFTTAMTQLRSEVLDAADFIKLPADNSLIDASIPLLERHAINSADAIVLQTARVLATQLRPVGDDLVLVAADLRLLRAAQAEGLFTFNPETQSQAELRGLL